MCYLRPPEGPNPPSKAPETRLEAEESGIPTRFSYSNPQATYRYAFDPPIPQKYYSADYHGAVRVLNKEASRFGYGYSIDGTRKRRDGVSVVKLRCAYSRKYTSTATGARTAGVSSRMSECSARARLHKRYDEDMEVYWEYSELCTDHNHPHEVNRLALPQFRQLDQDYKDRVAVAARLRRPVKEVLKEFLEEGVNTCFDDVSNLMAKARKRELGGKTKVEALLNYLDDYQLGQDKDTRYFVRKEFDKWHRLRTLFFAHPESFEVIRANPDVIMLDCTYKSNKFKMPFLHIVGMTSMGTTYDVAYCFMPDEKKPSYIFAVQALRELLLEKCGISPKIVLTDDCRELKDALAAIFPNLCQRLCIWHLNKHVQTEAVLAWDRRDGVTEEEKDAIDEKRLGYIYRWDTLKNLETEEQFDKEWESIKEDYAAYPALLQYMEVNMLPKKEQWAECFCRFYPTFGQQATSRLEGSHCTLKTNLSIQTGHIFDVVKDIHLMIKAWKNKYWKELATDRSRIVTIYRNTPEFLHLHYEVTSRCLQQLLKQLKLAKEPAFDGTGCTGGFTAQFGLPCKHKLYDRLYFADSPQQVVYKEDIDQHWWYRPQRVPDLPAIEFIPQDPAIVKAKGRPKGSTTTVAPLQSQTCPPSPAPRAKPASQRHNLPRELRDPSHFEHTQATQEPPRTSGRMRKPTTKAQENLETISISSTSPASTDYSTSEDEEVVQESPERTAPVKKPAKEVPSKEPVGAAVMAKMLTTILANQERDKKEMARYNNRLKALENGYKFPNIGASAVEKGVEEEDFTISQPPRPSHSLPKKRGRPKKDLLLALPPSKKPARTRTAAKKD